MLRLSSLLSLFPLVLYKDCGLFLKEFAFLRFGDESESELAGFGFCKNANSQKIQYNHGPIA